MTYDIERVVNNQTNVVLFTFGGVVTALRQVSKNSRRRYENDWMQDRTSGILEEHPAQAISRTLKDDYEELFDTISVKNDDYGRTVYAHVDGGSEDVTFESDGDSVVGYVKLPVIGKPCRTQKDVDALISEVVKFLERHQSF